MATPPGPKFTLGRVVVAPGVLEKLDHAKIAELLRLHEELDRAGCADEDIEERELSLREGFSIHSSFAVNGAEILVVTEGDRSVTTVFCRRSTSAFESYRSRLYVI